MTLRHGQALGLMVLVTLLWSTAGVVTRQLESAQSLEVTFWRSAFTFVALMVLLPVWRGPKVFAHMAWRNPHLWLSGVCWATMFTAFMVALTLTTVANVLIALSIGPLLTALVSRVVNRRPLPWHTWTAIVLAGLGIAWMYGASLEMGSRQAVLGSLVAMAVPIAASVQWTLTQRAQQQGSAVDFVPAVWLGAAISSVFALPWAFPFQASGHDVLWLAGLGAFQLALPCVLSVVAARVLPAAELSLLALLEVVFGIAWAWLFAGEALSGQALWGSALVLLALLGHQLLTLKKR
jgi:drug/metabolite transporter (DMT)-like permease